MATLWITEYEDIGELHGDSTFSLREPALAEQTVTITGTSTQCSAFNASSKIVCIYSDVDCHIRFGTNPTATTSTRPLPAGASRILTIGDATKLAVRT